VIEDQYCDDPILDKQSTKRSKLVGILGIASMLIVGAAFLQTTFAGNITLNSSGLIEFGQGFAATVACSGGNNLTITPQATFKNASNSGSFYFNSVTVSNIPNSCFGDDFTIQAYGNGSSSPLALFNSASTDSVISNNAGTFQVGIGGSGTSVISGSGTFKVTFDTPVALASAVSKVTIQSGKHTPFTCAEGVGCSLGQYGPGGGLVFYAPGNTFTVAGSPCGTSCRYLEVAPYNWNGNGDVVNFWSSDSSHQATASFNVIDNGLGNQAIGAGFLNTLQMVTSNPNTGYIADSSGAAYTIRNYAASDSSAGLWYLPSLGELRQVANYVGLQQFGFATNWYWASSEVSNSQATLFSFYNGDTTTNGTKYASQYRARPIRAF